MLDPVFHFLDWIIAECGLYLYLAFVWRPRAVGGIPEKGDLFLVVHLAMNL
jgi:hypothetical protein